MMGSRPFRPRDELVGMVSLATVGLILALVLPRFAPHTPFVHFDQGRFHLGIMTVACAICLAILGSRLRAVLALLIGGVAVLSVYIFSLSHLDGPVADRANGLSILSFNVLGLNPRQQDIVDLLLERDVDVAFILEGQRSLLESDELRVRYPYRASCDINPGCDLLVFSRQPLNDATYPRFHGAPGRFFTAKVNVEGAEVALIAVHMTKPWWGEDDKVQMRQLTRFLDGVEGPLVLAGDFNTQPFVETFRRPLLEEASLRLVSGMVATWPAFDAVQLSNLGFAIDHVLIRGNIDAVSVERLADPLGSNHLGFISQFALY